MLSECVADLAVRDANDKGTMSWRLGARLVGGVNSGAWGLEALDGSSAVLKLALTRDWATQMQRAERSVGVVRAAGYPTPAWLVTGVMTSGIGYQVQELVPGRCVDMQGIEQVRELIRVLELQAGVDPDPDRCWSAFLADELTTGLDDLRDSAARAGAAGRELDEACGRLLAPVDGPFQFPRADMVHGDFRTGNILFDDGRVSGVIDIEAIGSGTRVFDYATLLDHEEIEPEAVELLVAAAVEIAGPDVLRACFAWVALDLVRFMSTAEQAFTDQQRTDRIRSLIARVQTVDRLARA